jgi:hypothetical protein
VTKCDGSGNDGISTADGKSFSPYPDQRAFCNGVTASVTVTDAVGMAQLTTCRGLIEENPLRRVPQSALGWAMVKSGWATVMCVLYELELGQSGTSWSSVRVTYLPVGA